MDSLRTFLMLVYLAIGDGAFTQVSRDVLLSGLLLDVFPRLIVSILGDFLWVQSTFLWGL